MPFPIAQPSSRRPRLRLRSQTPSDRVDARGVLVALAAEFNRFSALGFARRGLGGRSFAKSRSTVSVFGLVALLAAGIPCWRQKAPPDPSVAPPAFFVAPPPVSTAASGTAEDAAAARAAWTLETDDGGTVRVSYRGAKVMTFHYLFWGKN